MTTIIIDRNDIIINDDAGPIREFIILGVNAFFEELKAYINHNSDPKVLDYANEQTLLSLFVNGLIRKNGSDNSITALQEYSTVSNGRADAFIRYNSTGIWIESKNIKDNRKIRHEKHWDIDLWLKWDRETAFKQLMKYIMEEKNGTNDTYEGHYGMTLVFKTFNEPKEIMFLNAEKLLAQKKGLKYERNWFYNIGYIETGGNEDKSLGIEVYGTFTGDLKNT